MPTCASCGEENPDRARFCLGCGTALAVEEALGLSLERNGRRGPAGEAYARALALCEEKGILPRAERLRAPHDGR